MAGIPPEFDARAKAIGRGLKNLRRHLGVLDNHVDAIERGDRITITAVEKVHATATRVLVGLTKEVQRGKDDILEAMAPVLYELPPKIPGRSTASIPNLPHLPPTEDGEISYNVKKGVQTSDVEGLRAEVGRMRGLGDRRVRQFHDMVEQLARLKEMADASTHRPFGEL